MNKCTNAKEVNYFVILFPYKGEKQPKIKCNKVFAKGENAYGIRLMHNDYEDYYGERKPGATGEIEMPKSSQDKFSNKIQTDADYF